MPLHRVPNQARAALLWGLGVFAALQVGLTLAAETWLPDLRDPDYAYHARALHRRLAATPGRPTTLVILGSSRAAVGLQAAQLQDHLGRELDRPIVVYNFGLIGAAPLTQLLALKRLLREGVRPDLLVIEVVPPFLAGQPGPRTSELSRLPASRLSWRDLALLDRYGLCSGRLRRAWWRCQLVPSYERRLAILRCALPSWLPPLLQLARDEHTDDSGWIALGDAPPPEVYNTAVEYTRREYFPYFLDFRPGNPACRALRELLELCRAQGITPALLLMPEGGPFRGWYSPETWGLIESFLDELSRAYGATVVNARAWVPDGYFFDGHHLTTAGAAEFTRRLGEDRSFNRWIRVSTQALSPGRDGRR